MLAALSFVAGAAIGAYAAYHLLTRPTSTEDTAQDWRTTGERHAHD